MLSISVSRMPLTSSASVPSTTSIIPFFKNSSSILPAASSRAKSPSLRLTFDNSIILFIVSPGSTLFSLKGSANDLIPAIKPDSLLEQSTAESEPPIVIIAEGASRKFNNAGTPPF